MRQTHVYDTSGLCSLGMFYPMTHLVYVVWACFIQWHIWFM